MRYPLNLRRASSLLPGPPLKIRGNLRPSTLCHHEPVADFEDRGGVIEWPILIAHGDRITKLESNVQRCAAPFLLPETHASLSPLSPVSLYCVVMVMGFRL